MNFLIIGCGSIGKRHIRNLISLGIDKKNIFIVDPREDRRKEILELGVQNSFSKLEDALEEHIFNFSIVCSPTNLHIIQGLELAKKKIHILMEKPLAHNLDLIEEFQELVNKNNLIVMMAYIFRFSPAINKIKELINENTIGKILFVRGEFSEYLPDWHPYEDYRSFYMAEKNQGGGSILDQSHIMDLIHFLFGDFKSVYALNGNLSNLEVNSDDYSQLSVRLKNGIIASIHTDMFGREHKKELEIKGENGNIFWSSNQNLVKIYLANEKKNITYDNFPDDFNMNYIHELRHFIDCCEGKTKSISTLEDGIKTMKLILSSYESVKSKSEVVI